MLSFVIYTRAFKFLKKGKFIMLLQILFGFFSFLLLFLSYFLISGKAIIFIPTIQTDRKKQAQIFFLSLGIIFIFFGIISLFLIFYHPIWLSLVVLGLVSLFSFIFIFGLNFFIWLPITILLMSLSDINSMKTNLFKVQ